MSREVLQKILARAGVASRRKSEDLIKAGRVAVDGITATPGQRVDPNTQSITVDGTPMQGLVARLSATPGRLRWAGRPLGADGEAIRAELDER